MVELRSLCVAANSFRSIERLISQKTQTTRWWRRMRAQTKRLNFKCLLNRSSRAAHCHKSICYLGILNVLKSNYGKMSYRWFHNDAYRSPVVWEHSERTQLHYRLHSLHVVNKRPIQNCNYGKNYINTCTSTQQPQAFWPLKSGVRTSLLAYISCFENSLKLGLR